jgi:hypothetical protein
LGAKNRVSPDNVVTLDDDRTAMSEVLVCSFPTCYEILIRMLTHRAKSPIPVTAGTARGERFSDDPSNPMVRSLRRTARMSLLHRFLSLQPDETLPKMHRRRIRVTGGLKRVLIAASRPTALVCSEVLSLVHSGSPGNLPRDTLGMCMFSLRILP